MAPPGMGTGSVGRDGLVLGSRPFSFLPPESGAPNPPIPDHSKHQGFIQSPRHLQSRPAAHWTLTLTLTSASISSQCLSLWLQRGQPVACCGLSPVSSDRKLHQTGGPPGGRELLPGRPLTYYSSLFYSSQSPEDWQKQTHAQRNASAIEPRRLTEKNGAPAN